MGTLLTGRMVGDFRVQRLLGEGTQGKVYLAQDLTLGRRVALKVLEASGADTERLLDEARTTARFNHPNIVTIYGVGTFDEGVYLALEYLEGETLRHWLSHGPLAVVEALRVARALADAMADAHRHGIVHSDLKPENIVVLTDGRLKVLDFGLSRLVGAEHGGASGTPAYMSPERWQGQVPSAVMDVWSLGIILFEMLEGRRPVADDRLMLEVLSPKPVKWPASISSLSGAEVITATLTPLPQARPTAQALLAALAEAIDTFAPPRPQQQAPFRGLRAFTEDDAADFVGRDADVQAALEVLRRRHKLLLVGASGVGKSSFVGAGLAPRLVQAGAMLERFRPTDKPLSRLAMAIGGDARLAQTLRERPAALLEPVLSRPNLVLVIDQMEEAFTLADRAECAAFLACLELLSESGACQVVLSLRDDFLGRCLGELHGHFSDSVMVLTALSRASLEASVREPLRRVQYGFDDPALLETLVGDVYGRQAALPLLQFVCEALWNSRDEGSRQLKAADYASLGGAAGALTAQADRVLRQLPAADVDTARGLLLRLITSDDTRKPVASSTLLEGLPSGARIVELLINQRLLVSGSESGQPEPTVELAHEALISQWPLLRRWLDESRDDRAFRDEVEQAAALWVRRGRRDDETWVGATLAHALQRREAMATGFSKEAGAFLQTGEARDVALRRRRRRVLGGVMAGLVVIASGGVSAAVYTRSQQEQIRMAAADMGVFELQLMPFDLDQQMKAVTPKIAPTLKWKLRGVDPDDTSLPGRVYSDEEVLRLPAGPSRERVEARSGAAFLEVDRGPSCAPSVISLRHLPGYTERLGVKVPSLEVPVPTCQATNAGMVAIPAGPFIRNVDVDGGSQDEPGELPAYSIDRTEVTRGAYGRYAALERWTGDGMPSDGMIEYLPDGGSDPLPIVGVTWHVARNYCRFMGGALPSIVQWQKAFRGGLVIDGKPNPMPARLTVNAADAVAGAFNLAGEDDGFADLAAAGSSPADISPYGVLDLAGNVSEWSNDRASGRYRGMRVVLGAGWSDPFELDHHLVSWRNARPDGAIDFAIGVRCVQRTLTR